MEREGKGLSFKRTTVLRTANRLGLLLVGLGLIAGGVLLLVIQDILVLSASYLLGAALWSLGWLASSAGF